MDLFFNQFLNPVKLLGVGALMGVIAVLMTIGKYSVQDMDNFNVYSVNSSVTVFYYIAFVLAFCGMVGGINKRLANKGEIIGWLTLPATTLEKYLSKLIVAFVAVPLYIFVALCISELLRMLFYSIFYSEFNTLFINPLDMIIKPWDVFYEGFVMLTLLVSFFFFCSFIFRKNTLSKTILTGLLLSVLSIVVISVTMALSIDFVGVVWMNVSPIDMGLYSGYMNSVNIMMNVFVWLLIMFFIIWPYFRMKETELIQRF